MLSELQQYLRRAAAQHRETIRSGPFQLYVDATTDSPFANYAIPDEAARPTADDVSALLRAFAAHERRPAFEYLPACAPAVEDPLLAGGLAVTRRIPLMTCDATTVASPPPPDGVAVEVAGPETPDARLRELIAVQYAAFGMAGHAVSAEDVARVREGAVDGVVAYATAADGDAGGRVLGGGRALPIRDGFTELTGIAIAADARRRGIAGAVTARLAAESLARGARCAFLTPGDDGAERVYERAGFATAGEMLHLG